MDAEQHRDSHSYASPLTYSGLPLPLVNPRRTSNSHNGFKNHDEASLNIHTISLVFAQIDSHPEYLRVSKESREQVWVMKILVTGKGHQNASTVIVGDIFGF